MRSIIQSEKEIWKDIKGYEGIYQISNLGRVKSISRTIGNRHKPNIRVQSEDRILKPCVKDNKYLYISLTKNRSRNNKYIHRLVAEAFIPNKERKECVNHIDYDVTNNNVNNLEWVTQKENVRHSIEHLCCTKNSKKKTCTGYKYIDIRHGRYRVQIKRKLYGFYEKSFDTLEEAVKARDEVISLWQKV